MLRCGGGVRAGESRPMRGRSMRTGVVKQAGQAAHTAVAAAAAVACLFGHRSRGLFGLGGPLSWRLLPIHGRCSFRSCELLLGARNSPPATDSKPLHQGPPMRPLSIRLSGRPDDVEVVPQLEHSETCPLIHMARAELRPGEQGRENIFVRPGRCRSRRQEGGRRNTRAQGHESAGAIVRVHVREGKRDIASTGDHERAPCTGESWSETRRGGE